MEYEFWGKDVFCIITGANRGLGKSISLELTRRLKEVHEDAALKILLMSRSGENLETTKNELIELNPTIEINVLIGCLSEKKILEEFDLFLNSSRKNFDQVILVHNAGSLYKVDKTVRDHEVEDFDELNKYLKINVTSQIVMTSSFIRAYDSIPNKVIINISSLAAIKAIKGLSLYCIGKAARDSYFRSVALEESISVLNYSPGPLKTAMTDILKEEGFNTEYFKNTNLLDSEVSVQKMISILESKNYENGDHIDFYDANEIGCVFD